MDRRGPDRGAEALGNVGTDLLAEDPDIRPVGVVAGQ